MPTPALTFVAQIHKRITMLFQELDKLNPDSKHNTGRLIGRALFWDQIEKYAKKQSEIAWDTLEKEEIVTYDGLPPGDHTLAESPHFIVMAKVSSPRRAFSPDALATSLKKRYKVPEVVTKEEVEKAKIPGKSVNTLTIMER